MPRGWDWAQWIAFERDHPEPTKEDRELADRVARIDGVTKQGSTTHPQRVIVATRIARV